MTSDNTPPQPELQTPLPSAIPDGSQSGPFSTILHAFLRQIAPAFVLWLLNETLRWVSTYLGADRR